MSINNLLIARTCEPPQAVGVPGDENVQFGYDSLTGAADGTISGSTVGGVSALPDAIVRIRVKGDFSGPVLNDPDGIIDANDSQPWVDALFDLPGFGGPGQTQQQVWLGDYAGGASFGVVDPDDSAAFIAALFADGFGGTPCP